MWFPLKARASLIALAIVVLVLTAGGIAYAAFPDTNVDTYTGCLNTGGTAGGQIGQVAVGLSPLKACGSNQRLAHLSGGDITRVTAGSGLSGGGDNGSVTLSLAGGYSLPQTCASGQVAGWDGTSWKCTDPVLPKLYEATGSVETVGDGGTWTVVQLDIPTAGTYLVTAKSDLGAGADDATLDCKLHHGDASGPVVDESFVALEALADVGTNASTEMLVVQGKVNAGASDSITVTCHSPGGSQLSAHSRIDALQVST